MSDITTVQSTQTQNNQFWDKKQKNPDLLEVVESQKEALNRLSHTPSVGDGLPSDGPSINDEPIPQPTGLSELTQIGDTVPVATKPEFGIDDYPAWKSVWESCPQAVRQPFAPIIANGHLPIDTLKALELRFLRETEDKKLDKAYTRLGLQGNCAASADYNHRQIVVYPEFNRMATQFPQAREHMLGHVIGHFAGAALVNPKTYAELVANRPLESNGCFIRQIKPAAPDQSDHNAWLHVMLADDLSDLFKLKKASEEELQTNRNLLNELAAEMVYCRLTRAMSDEVLEKFIDQASEGMRSIQEEVCQLILFLLASLNLAKADTVYQNDWLLQDALGQSNYCAQIPLEAGLSLSQPSESKKQEWMKRFISLV